MKPFNLEEYLKRPLRKVVTRDGQSVKIHCTDFDDNVYPIIARVEGDAFSTSFTKDGKYHELGNDSKYDLFFAPEKYEGWVNVYLDADNDSYVGNWIYNSKEEAEEHAKKRSGYKTTTKIEWEE